MNPRVSLRARFLLAITGLVLIGFTALTVFAGRQISAATIADFEERLAEQAAIIARGLREPVEHVAEGETTNTELNSALQEYATQFGIQVALFDRSGHAWIGDPIQSNLAPEEAPEVRAALAGQVLSNTRLNPANSQVVYTAAPIYEDGRLLAIVHLATPLASTTTLVIERWTILLLGMVVLLIVTIFVSLWLSASLTRPLAQLQQSTLQMSAGDFSKRLPEDRQDEIGQLAMSFNHMAGQVKAMIDEQRAFAGNASHELRTPLTAIRLRSEALRDGVVDEETAQRYIVEIDQEAARLGDLVQDLTLISRLDSGRLEAGREQIDPLRFARLMAQEFVPQMESKQIRFSLETPQQLPTVSVGLSHMQVVFRNVLNNALKYTPAGGKITWTLASDDGNLHSIIADNGMGIATEDLSHLYDRFYRADKAHTRDKPGVGLGLSLVKLILDFYGGRIVVESPGMNQGTAVQIWWPLR